MLLLFVVICCCCYCCCFVIAPLPPLSITRTPHLPFHPPSQPKPVASSQDVTMTMLTTTTTIKPHQQSQNPHLRIGSTSGHTTLPSWVDRRQKECMKISQQVGTKGKEIRGLIRRGKEGLFRLAMPVTMPRMKMKMKEKMGIRGEKTRFA